MPFLKAIILLAGIALTGAAAADNTGAPRDGGKYMNSEVQWSPNIAKLPKLIKATCDRRREPLVAR